MKKIVYIFCFIPLCIISILTMIYLFSNDKPFFSVRNIRINGANQLQDVDIASKISPLLKENLLSLDVPKMKEIISAHPFVKEVNIKRTLPFSVIIDLKEKKPSALWINNEGIVSILDESGEPYRRLTKGSIGNMFVINAINRSDVKSLYRQTNGWIAEGIIKRDSISEIAYNEGSVTIFDAEDGVEIVLGKEDHKARLKRAVSILEDARRRGLLIKSIDARFEKGGIIQERKG